MAARTRASFPDDDSIIEQVNVEMVRVNAPPTASTATTAIDPDEPTALIESTTTNVCSGAPRNDFLIQPPPEVVEGINRDYEIPNIWTYKKVIQ